MGGQLVKCEVCEAIVEAGVKYRNHIEWHKAERENEDCIIAVRLANERGIYAIPCKHSGKIYWKPRLPSGLDPDMGWLFRHQPTHTGWKSWADAILALANYQDGK